MERGSLTVWLDGAAVEGWLQAERSGRRGASQLYSDAAITAALLLKGVYHLPLRATQGLVRSVLELMHLSLPSPHYSTLCRRQANLQVTISTVADSQRREPIHLVIDSTGCKIYGEGEWKVRQHSWSKRRTWRKIHLGVDESSGEIRAVVLSTNDVSDGEVLPQLLEQVKEPLRQVGGDSSYDQRKCYQTLHERGQIQNYSLRVTVPPRKGAHIWQHGNSRANKEEPLARDENLRRIREIGRVAWKEECGYHRRSIAETAMSRYKRLLGKKLRAREVPQQATEAFIGCLALNRMLDLGRPQSYAL